MPFVTQMQKVTGQGGAGTQAQQLPGMNLVPGGGGAGATGSRYPNTGLQAGFNLVTGGIPANKAIGARDAGTLPGQQGLTAGPQSGEGPPAAGNGLSAAGDVGPNTRNPGAGGPAMAGVGGATMEAAFPGFHKGNPNPGIPAAESGIVQPPKGGNPQNSPLLAGLALAGAQPAGATAQKMTQPQQPAAAGQTVPGQSNAPVQPPVAGAGETAAASNAPATPPAGTPQNAPSMPKQPTAAEWASMTPLQRTEYQRAIVEYVNATRAATQAANSQTSSADQLAGGQPTTTSTTTPGTGTTTQPATATGTQAATQADATATGNTSTTPVNTGTNGRGVGMSRSAFNMNTGTYHANNENIAPGAQNAGHYNDLYYIDSAGKPHQWAEFKWKNGTDVDPFAAIEMVPHSVAGPDFLKHVLGYSDMKLKNVGGGLPDPRAVQFDVTLSGIAPDQQTLMSIQNPALQALVSDGIGYATQLNQLMDGYGTTAWDQQAWDKAVRTVGLIQGTLGAYGIEWDPTGGSGAYPGQYNTDPRQASMPFVPNVSEFYDASTRKLLGIGPGSSPEEKAAAYELALGTKLQDAQRRDYAKGVNILGEDLASIENDPTLAKYVAGMNDLNDNPILSDWQGINNRMASDLATQREWQKQDLATSAGRRGMSAGSMSGLNAGVDSQYGMGLARSIGENKVRETDELRNARVQGLAGLKDAFSLGTGAKSQAAQRLASMLGGKIPDVSNPAEGATDTMLNFAALDMQADQLEDAGNKSWYDWAQLGVQGAGAAATAYAARNPSSITTNGQTTQT